MACDPAAFGSGLEKSGDQHPLELVVKEEDTVGFKSLRQQTELEFGPGGQWSWLKHLGPDCEL